MQHRHITNSINPPKKCTHNNPITHQMINDERAPPRRKNQPHIVHILNTIHKQLTQNQLPIKNLTLNIENQINQFLKPYQQHLQYQIIIHEHMHHNRTTINKDSNITINTITTNKIYTNKKSNKTTIQPTTITMTNTITPKTHFTRPDILNYPKTQ